MASFLRVAEAKKRNRRLATTSPNSRSGMMDSVPSSMPNGATVRAFTGLGIQHGGMLLSIPSSKSGTPPRMRTPRPRRAKP